MIFTEEIGKILWEVIIFITYILVCGSLVEWRYSKKTCLVLTAGLVAAIFLGQGWLFYSSNSIMKILTMLPVTAYLPSIIYLHLISGVGFLQTVLVWGMGLLVYDILKIYLKILLWSVKIGHGAQEGIFYVLLITACLLVGAGLMLFFVRSFLRKPFRMYVKGSRASWMLLCIPVLVILLMYSYIGNNIGNILMQIFLFLNVLAIFFLIIRSLISFASIERMRESEQEIVDYMQVQRREYEDVCVKMEAGRIFRHDMRHHLLVLENMAKEGDTGRIVDYIGSLRGQLSNTERKVYCENPMVNAVLSSYVQNAMQDCVIDTEINVPKTIGYDEVDICAILANTLENAKRECMKISEAAKRYIRIKADLIEEWKFLITVENTSSAPVEIGEDGLPKASVKKGHGIGLKSVSAAVKKYGGVFQCGYQEGKFCFNAVLFRPAKHALPEKKNIPRNREGENSSSAILVSAFFILLSICIVFPLAKILVQTKDMGSSEVSRIEWGDLKFSLNVPADLADSVYGDMAEGYIDKMKEKFLFYASQKYNGHVAMDISYRIIQDDDQYLCICFDAVLNAGGSGQYSRYFTVDKRSGKILALDDLYRDGYLEVISAEILRQMEEQVNSGEANYFIPGGIWSEDECFKGITEDRNFYLNMEKELVIVFDEYEVAPGSMGMPEFIIPEEVLSEVLR